MEFKIQLIFEDNSGQTHVDNLIQINKAPDIGYCAGLSLQESKQLLQALQQKITLQQAHEYTSMQRPCSICHRKRRIKGHSSMQYRTLFGTVVIPNLRLYECKCRGDSKKTLSVLNSWMTDHTSPELQYIESKWASYLSFERTSKLLADVLPISVTHNAASIRNHLHKVASRQEKKLKGKPICISGCQMEWAKLPKPDKPITVGIDGGYVRHWLNKRSNFEVIVGKSFSQSKRSKRFGLVQSMDKRSQRRLLHVLKNQGMQENQQIIFLSDGADNVRDLQFIMHPEAEHILDWFHLTMRFTVLNQFIQGMMHSDHKIAEEFKQYSTKAKHYLWHGNVKEALDALEECMFIIDDNQIKYKNQKKLDKHLDELVTYIENNAHIIPNYGERYRYGESISSSFVESTINEVVTKRMVKKQQMQWSPKGAHYLLQVRTSVLNEELADDFEDWYPGLAINDGMNSKGIRAKKAA